MIDGLREGNIIGYDNGRGMRTVFISTFDHKDNRVFGFSLDKKNAVNMAPSCIFPLLLDKRRMTIFMHFRVFDQWVENGCWVQQVENGFEIWYGKEEKKDRKVIQYVHELQNYFFEHTGDELRMPEK